MSTEDPEEKELPFSTAEGAEITLTEYDKVRTPHPLLPPNTFVRITPKMLSDLTCPICLDLLSQTMATKECLHRFCSECITMALLRGNKECPTCRKKLISKRSLRPDPNFDLLINSIFPDRSVFEKMQSSSWVTATNTECSSGSNDDSGESVESESPDEEGIRKRSHEDDSEESDEDHGGKRLKIDEPEEHEVPAQLTAEGGRPSTESITSCSPPKLEMIIPKTEPGLEPPKDYQSSSYPPCDFDEQDDESHDGPSAEELLQIDEYEDIETDSEESDESENDEERRENAERRNSKMKRHQKSLEDGEVISDESGSEDNKEVEKNGDEYEDSSSGWYTDHGTEDDPDSSGQNSEWLEDIETAMRMELEKRRKQDEQKGDTADVTTEQKATENGATPKESANDHHKSEPMEADEDKASAAAYDEYVVDHDLIEFSFGSIHPEQSYEDIIKVPSLYDTYVPLSHRIPSAIPTEGDFDETDELDEGMNGDRENGQDYEENAENSGDEEAEPIERDAYEFVDETQENGNGIELPQSNNLGHEHSEISYNPNGQLTGGMKDTDNDSENCDLDFYNEEELHEEIDELTEAVAEIGEDAVLDLKEEDDDEDSYTTSTYSSSGCTSVENISELSSEIELPAGAKENGEQIKNDLVEGIQQQLQPTPASGAEISANPSSAATQQMINSLYGLPIDKPLMTASSYVSNASTPNMASVISSANQYSLSGNIGISHASTPTYGQMHGGISIAAESPTQISLKDVPTGSCKERLQKWLADYPSSPLAPEESMDENLERSHEDVGILDAAVSGIDEIEIELLPAACLTAREVPEEMLTPRYIRAKHDTTMEHLSEFIHQRVMEEVQSNQLDFDADPAPATQRPEHFYVFSRNAGHHIRKIFLHETILTAQSAMTKDDHLIIFFDIVALALHGERQSVLEEVVPANFLSLPIVHQSPT